MRTKKQRKIQRLVEQLLQRAKVETPPVPVEQVAKLLGAQVHYNNFRNKDAISGILVQANDRIVIGVNEKHTKHRQRFTIAHELGHLVLHSHRNSYVDRNLPSLVRLRDETSSSGSDPDEVEANAFAAELLMPTSMLEHDMSIIGSEEFDERSIDDLAEKYAVSVQAMTFRLVNLGFVRG